MRFSEAFQETMFRFKLKGTDLAEQSGLTPTQISDFRNGKNLRIDSVEKLLDAMPRDARLYMLQLVANEDTDRVPLPKRSDGENALDP